jgi:hypothetical protein
LLAQQKALHCIRLITLVSVQALRDMPPSPEPQGDRGAAAFTRQAPEEAPAPAAQSLAASSVPPAAQGLGSPALEPAPTAAAVPQPVLAAVGAELAPKQPDSTATPAKAASTTAVYVRPATPAAPAENKSKARVSEPPAPPDGQHPREEAAAVVQEAKPQPQPQPQPQSIKKAFPFFIRSATHRCGVASGSIIHLHHHA